MAELKQIRYSAKYIAELFERDLSDFDARCANPDDVSAGIKNIFHFSFQEPNPKNQIVHLQLVVRYLWLGQNPHPDFFLTPNTIDLLYF